MKTQKYLVTIEMPDGDMIGPGWIRDIIQTDCDVEEEGRDKVSVEEYDGVDWDEYRREVAKNTLCAMLIVNCPGRFSNEKPLTAVAVDIADELIEQLKEESK